MPCASYNECTLTMLLLIGNFLTIFTLKYIRGYEIYPNYTPCMTNTLYIVHNTLYTIHDMPVIVVSNVRFIDTPSS